MKFSLLRRFREHRIFAATPEVARQIEAFGERFAELAEECFVALTTEPFPATQKGGKWGLHLRLRDNKDIVGDAEAWLWHVPSYCRLAYTRQGGDIMIWSVRLAEP